MTTKIGIQDYKGIKIDYSREESLGDFAIATLKDRYFWENEDHAQEAFARAAIFGATYDETTDYALA